MIIDELVLNNFGTFKGVQTIILTPTSNSKPVILFGGYNGTGKTTLLDALQLVLYGKFARCSNRGSLPYEEFLARSIHKSVAPHDGASIELKFHHMSNGKEHTFRIRRMWSEKRKGIHEHVEVIKDGLLDRVLTEEWYQYIEEYIPSRISNLFFFDGEKIEEFASDDNASQLLSVAVHSLLGLDVIDQLFNDLLVLERRKKVSIKDSIERKNIDAIIAEIQELDKRRSDLVQTKASLQNSLDQEEKYYKNIDIVFRKEGGELYEKREEIESQKVSTKDQLHSLEEKLRELSAGPFPLLLVNDLLQAIEGQDHKEELAYQTQALINALRERDETLLRLVKENNAPEVMIETLNKFLSDDINQRHKEANTESYLHLDSETRKSLKTLLVSLPEIKSSTIELSNEADNIRAGLDDIDRKLAGIPSQESIAPLIAERHKVIASIDKINSQIASIDDEIAKLNREKEQKQSWLNSQLEDIVTDDFHQEDVLRIVHHSELVRETLQGFRRTVVLRHVERIGDLIYDSFSKLIRKQSLIKNISISPYDYKLELRGSDGKNLLPERLSAGERQLLAVSIIWGLARASGRPLPTAIDTPLGRLDSYHRRHMVEGYFPYASHQVLLFSTDEEINRKYYEKLKPYIGRSYLLEYDDTDSATQIREGYFW
jgi:DNA sulfur modification protein DndD